MKYANTAHSPRSDTLKGMSILKFCPLGEQHHKRNMSENRRKAAMEARKREEEIESLFSICDWDHSQGLAVR